MPENEINILGRVIEADTTKGRAGLVVEALILGKPQAGVLGRAKTGPNGSFRLVFEAAKLKEILGRGALFFRVLERNEVLLSTERTLLWALGDTQRRILIELPATSSRPVGEKREVKGRVVQPDGTAIAKVGARLFRKTLRREELLGEATTDEHGAYRIRYELKDDTDKPDLIVRVFSPRGSELGASPILFSAEAIQTINLVLGEEPFRGATEFTRVRQAVEPLLDDVDVATLKLDDASFLAVKTGVDPLQLAHFRESSRLAEALDLPAEVFYGLFRQNLPLQPQALLNQHPDVLRRALPKSIRDNVVAAGLEKKIDQQLQQLKRRVALRALDAPRPVGGSALSALLGSAGLGVQQQQRFIHAYGEHDGPIEAFWEELPNQNDFNAQLTQQLQFTLQLGILTRNHVPLVRQIQGMQSIQSLRDLTRLTRRDWKELVERQNVGVPPGVSGETEEARRGEYANSLAALVEDAFPTAVIGQRLKTDDFPFGDNLKQFFDNNPDFEFRNQPVGSYIAANPDALAGIGQPDESVAQLQTIQRLFSLIPDGERYSTIVGLAKAGLHSAHAIRQVGRTSFISTFENVLGGEVRASAIYAGAERRSALALQIFARHSAAFDPVGLYALQDRPEAVEGVPNYETLFGSLDLCSCEHCESVLSPAAYLVDLLHFLGSRPSIANSARQVLFSRRPDLGEIELNCENTNTPLPYVDLVNEILERAVDPGGSTAQTTLTAEELRTNPEHLRPQAYDALAQAAFPWNLPFDLWVEEARVYLRHLGVPRQRLMERFRRAGNAPLEVDVAVELLGLNPFDKDVITGTALGSPSSFWGMTVADWVTRLGEAPTFLKQSGLSYEQLLDLLEVPFINPAGTIEVDFAGAGCKLEDAAIQGLTEEVLNRIHRFVRLQRKLGWTAHELGFALGTLNASQINDVFLTDLARVSRLRANFDVTPVELLSIWSGIESPGPRGGASLYEQLFLSRTVSNPADVAFVLNAAGNEVADTTAQIDDHVTAIQGALNLSADDLQRLITDVLTDASLNLQNLTLLYRASALARWLRLSVPDYLSLLALTGINPASPVETSLLAEKADLVRTSGLRISELDYLLRHVDDLLSGAQPAPEVIGLILSEIRSDLQKIQAEYGFVSDPTGEETNRRLAEILSEGTLTRVVALINRTSLENEAAQQALIGDQPVVFPDPADAFVQLVNPGNLVILEDRFNYVLQPLLAHLERSESENLIKRKMSDRLDLDVALVDRLLVDLITSPVDPAQGSISILLDPAFISSTEASITEAEFGNQFRVFRKLDKIATILSTSQLDQAQLEFLFQTAPGLGWLDLNALPETAVAGASALFSAWEKMQRFLELRRDFSRGEPDLLEVLASLQDPATTRPGFLQLLSDRTGWNLEDLDFLTGPSGFGAAFPTDFQDGALMLRLRDCFVVLKRLGVSAATVWDWAIPSVTFERALAIKQAGRSKHDKKRWLAVAKPLRDELREKQRRALVDFLVVSNPQFEDADDLFSHYLIDVEMSPCMMTSRIKQANSSIQLFVQRILINLEPGIQFSSDDAEEWQWMKHYRVWEANRKVFLYPENWIEPELRDDKTPFFEELESDLLQDEITPATVENAYLKYLRKLDTVARLEIAGIYEEREIDETILHVVARTRATPHTYYYRRWVNNKRWTPWERVDVDIEGDHLLPVVFNRQLHLIWPVFMPKAVEQVVSTDDQDNPLRYYEIKYAWSQLKDGAWQPKRISDSVVRTRNTRNLPSTDRYSFWTFFDTGNLVIAGQEMGRDGVLREELYPQVSFAGCDGGAANFYGTFVRSDPSPGTFMNWNHEYEGSGEHALRLLTAGRLINYGSYSVVRWLDETTIRSAAVLRSTPGKFRLAIPHADRPYISQAPFFYEDYHRSFFVTTSDKFRRRSPSSWGDWVITEKVRPERIDGVREMLDELVVQRLGEEFDPIDPRPFDPTGEPQGGLDPVLTGDLDRGGFVQGAFGLTGFNDLAGSTHPSAVDDAFGGSLKGAYGMETRALEARQVVNFGSRASRYALSIDAEDAPVYRAHLAYTANKAAWVYEPEIIVDSYYPIYWAGKQYYFHNFYHPFSCEMIRQLNRFGIPGLLDPKQTTSGLKRQLKQEEFFGQYQPTSVVKRIPSDEFDFSYEGAYSIYNWELFFHAPLLIATHLGTSRKFVEAQHWFHYIFDPTDVSSDPVPARFWKIKPFFEAAQGQHIQELLLLLDYSGTDPEKLGRRKALIDQVDEWRENPFKPHAVARLRLSAYQKTTVMKYLDNLIEWGDHLFRRDTIETVNEATQLYVLAAQILGRRPRTIPSHEGVKRALDGTAVRTFNDLEPHLDEFSNALINLETLLPPEEGETGSSMEASSPAILGPSLFFCIPRNEKLVGYWDTVADRLFKIRHCMNIEGVVRQLPLFEPPIDPGLLVRAAAAGVDLASALSDLNAPLPHYRFQFLVQKAVDLARDVRALGSAMLAALERRDAEELVLLRSTQETQLLADMIEVRKQQVDEAEEVLSGLEKSREVAQFRKQYYESRPYTNPQESLHMRKLEASQDLQTAAHGVELAVTALSLIPNFDLGAAGWGASPVVKASWGGINLGEATKAASQLLTFLSMIENQKATMASIRGSYDRRAEEWEFQAELADRGIEQIEKQIAAAAVRQAITELDLSNHEKQVENARNVDAYMRDKFTNEELYKWMISQLSTVYFQSYQLVYDLAKRAEKAYQHELGEPDASFIRFGYWDSLKKGLLAGDKLVHDVKRMEVAYLERNRREFEISKHVSLSLLNPAALVTLRESGSCFFQVPEALFDLDHPGHYLRRIKSVALTIPSVTGPYTSVGCKLTLLENRVRKNTDLGPGYGWTGLEDTRFLYNLGGIQSMVTSSAQEDSGLFELNLRDERFLPFERAGAVSSWRLELPDRFRQFDYDTISDVVLHIRYTARDGGDAFRTAAGNSLSEALKAMELDESRTGLLRLFSARRDYPDDWHRFLHTPSEADQTLVLDLGKERFPIHLRDQDVQIDGFTLAFKLRDSSLYDDSSPLVLAVTPPGPAPAVDVTLQSSGELGGLPLGHLDFSSSPKAPGEWRAVLTSARLADLPPELTETVSTNGDDHLRLNPDLIEDLGILCHYTY